VDDQNNLYINIGAGSNVCQNFTKFADKDPQRNPKNFRALQFSSCPEVEDPAIGQGLIRRYKINADHSVSPQFEIFAKGLRNSISLAWDAQHHLLLNGENGRDAINKLNANLLNADLPHERINVLSAGQNYGWPYCYDDGKNNPEWPNIDCSVFTKPTLLIPAHTAPLGMIVYQGTQFPKWYRGRPLLALHGYEPRGHRIVTFMQDEAGRPTGVPRSLVYDWEKRGLQEKGKPVGIAELPDGSVLIVEDEPQNKILRLFYDPRAGNGVPVQEIDRAVAVNPATAVDQLGLKAALAQKLAAPNPEPFVLFQHKVIDKICAECHQADGAPGVQLIPFDFAGNAKRIIAAGRTHDLITVIKGQGPLPSMPPQGWDQPDDQKEALDLLQKWIATLQ
jgi:cytochrome c5